MNRKIKYKECNCATNINCKAGVEYITFKKFDDLGVGHGFSTRVGGVSQGYFSTMNLSFHRNDNYDDVYENHKRFARAVGYDEERLVFSDQIHDTKIKMVTKDDIGKGIVRKSNIIGIDGLITNEKGIPLITFYADCVPLFFYSSYPKVVAMAHSGWRGTVNQIGRKMINIMVEKYGCNKKDIYVGIGPSICQDCYEISEDVAKEFRNSFTPLEFNKFMITKDDGKYLLDLWLVNKIILINAGICEENIAVTDICTCCNSDYLFSHRASNGKRGNLAGVIYL